MIATGIAVRGAVGVEAEGLSAGWLVKHGGDGGGGGGTAQR